ncbi:hypothetical protein G6F43_013595 [Rhizopus delemar]|nr:hypothetical protein G6F43_013595 [Rhizopus delemar]
MRKLNNQDFFRQHDGVEVYNKFGGNGFSNTPRPSNSNIRFMPQVQHSTNLSAHPRGQQYTSRYVEQNQKTVLRVRNSEHHVQTRSKTMGSTLSGCIRSKTQQTTPAVLVTHIGSESKSNRCLPTGLEDRRIVPVPTMETDSTCLETNKGTEVETGSISNTIMAKPVLASNDSEDETHCTSNNLEIEQQIDISRMAVINNYRIAHGLNNTTLQFLNQKIRLSTQRIQ